MSRLEYLLWGLDFMIGAVAYLSGGPYAALVAFLVGAVLIFIGLSRKDESNSSTRRPSILTDDGSPYPKVSRLRSWHKYGLAASILCVAILGCYWWFTRRPVVKPPVSAISIPQSHSLPPSDEKPIPPIFKLPSSKQKELDRLKDELFRLKAQMLDSPEHYKAKAARNDFRSTVEEAENQTGCLIDTAKFECFPKPPAAITDNEMAIDIRIKMVADELSKTFFWVIHGVSKVRVPIAMLISLTNRQSIPLKIDELYLDARSTNGWADIRMADSLAPQGPHTMRESPLVLQAKNANASMKGEYLLPTLYDRIIQPGDKVEGWIIAEYPKGIQYANSIGDMRLSLRAGDRWIASTIFPANPRESKNLPFEFYFTPLDTLITEDW